MIQVDTGCEVVQFLIDIARLGLLHVQSTTDTVYYEYKRHSMRTSSIHITWHASRERQETALEDLVIASPKFDCVSRHFMGPELRDRHDDISRTKTLVWDMAPSKARLSTWKLHSRYSLLSISFCHLSLTSSSHPDGHLPRVAVNDCHLDTRVSTVQHNAVQTQMGRLLVLRTAVLVMRRCLASGRDSPKRSVATFGSKTTITRCQTAQLHNSSSQPRPVECGRVTRQHRSLNGYNCVFILAGGGEKFD
jgi:hypothetical protein